MAKFSAKAYKKRLEASENCEACEKVPIPKLKEDSRFIFISYSHKDYKKVYADLADLYENGVPFRYDYGLTAGEQWDKEVRKWLSDPRCAGTIFYMSENLLLSESVDKEIQIIFGEDDSDELDDMPDAPEIGYFCVNLTDKKPSELIKIIGALKESDRTVIAPEDRSRRRKKLSHAFPDAATYRSFHESAHIDQLIRDIHTNFHIDPKYNLYSFGDTHIHGGNAIIEFKNHSIYSGAFKCNLFEGLGKMTYSGDAEYDGGWLNGKRHGQGTMRYPNGDIYIGEWAEDKQHGQGTLTRPDGRTYTGNWVEDQLCGPGIMRGINGTTYVGEWHNNKRHGKGTKIWANGKTYTGDWFNGKRQGHGTMQYTENWSYTGEWFHGHEHGYGTMTWSKNKVYVGQFENGKPHGKGTMREKGSEYTGFWENGQEHGQGKKIWSKNEFYVGEWKNGRRHGHGTMTWPDGRQYTGQWENDKRHGQGTMTWPDGHTETGQWVAGKQQK